jgi:hypothetical protein
VTETDFQRRCRAPATVVYRAATTLLAGLTAEHVALPPTQLIPTPPPDLYADVAGETYHRWDAVNNSRLNLLFDASPAHALAQILNPPKPTPAKVLGNAAHAMILQPEVFDATYAVAGRCAGLTEKGKGPRCSFNGKVCRGGEWFCDRHDPAPGAPGTVHVLPQDDYDACQRMRDAVLNHPVAGAYLRGPGEVELSGVFTDDDTGLPCKFRTDKLRGDKDVVFDLKTADDASPAGFPNSIYGFGYYRQGAHYLMGLAQHGRNFKHFIIGAVEKSPPYAVAVYRLTDESIEAGLSDRAKLMKLYAQCEESGVWPGYGFDADSGRYVVQDAGLPDWAWKRVG